MILTTLLLGLMVLVQPAGSVVPVWFGLVAAATYVGFGLVSDIFSFGWSTLRRVFYMVATLSLIGLSTLSQLTVLDVGAVVILASLAQLAYQLRTRSK